MTNGWDTLDKGLIHIQSETEEDKTIFHLSTKNGTQFKNLWIVYFWNFPINIIGLPLAMGNWNREIIGKGEVLYSRAILLTGAGLKVQLSTKCGRASWFSLRDGG